MTVQISAYSSSLSGPGAYASDAPQPAVIVQRLALDNSRLQFSAMRKFSKSVTHEIQQTGCKMNPYLGDPENHCH